MWFNLLLADGQAPPPPGGLESILPPLLFLGLPILVIVYFGMILPMRRQDKQRKGLIATLKKNDKIVNSGGIIGVVESVKDKEDEIVLRGGLRITLSSIVRVIPEDGGKAKEEKTGGA